MNRWRFVSACLFGLALSMVVLVATSEADAQRLNRGLSPAAGIITNGSAFTQTGDISGGAATTDVLLMNGGKFLMDRDQDSNDYMMCPSNDSCRLVAGANPAVQWNGAGASISGTLSVSSTIVSTRTTDLGWAVVDGTDNTACTSQCTSAAVFGFDLAGGATAPVIVGPTNAAADICLCAGAS